ncbi:Gfo/Idh/MocA family protein [Paenibacillus sp. J2TS4]|uniref:Gfo/Idh/MocA family protein n=1 Tax=Paenibacillus sp. J2TS4 TaxID=2807194 RepID=UPI001B1B5339|nr:Gfo/Idh/MocA family oxidoreductase [Paenibacillus sp. J2TS4]GIP31848.1 oxidoreductase [Paenibacillus sp. J2TS4]
MIHAALIGAGARGRTSYGPYALKNPREIKFVAVAEPDEQKRELFASQHQIPPERQYASWEQMLEQPQLCEALLICTADELHFAPTMQGLQQGYHILLEKPMSPRPEEVWLMAEEARKRRRLLLIGHVLRYTPFFRALKQLINEHRIGRIINIQWTEHVAYWHQAHSYVRGNWRNSDQSSPMILAKSCHDTDLIRWLVGEPCEQVSSFGGLTHFKPENAPEGSTERCIEGCAVESSCPYSALKLYYNEREHWPQYMVSLEPTLEARKKGLEEGIYGRCVYHCDNNVVDHQVVNMRFRNETTVSFTMVAFSVEGNRTFNIKGTEGEIEGDFKNNRLEIKSFSGRKEVIVPEVAESGHGGGDHRLMKEFVQLVSQGANTGETSALQSAESHMIAFASEQSRISGKTVSLQEYMEEVRRKAVGH